MTHWREIGTPDPNAVPKFRAVAYYRHSAQDRQENSIPLQRDQVRQWADENGVEIGHARDDSLQSGTHANSSPSWPHVPTAATRSPLTGEGCLNPPQPMKKPRY
jgi:hypothetical protein